jgi:hypothetical protein
MLVLGKKKDPDLEKSEQVISGPFPGSSKVTDGSEQIRNIATSVVEPKLFVSVPAPTFKKFRLRL